MLPGKWYHAAVVHDGRNQVVYRNGERVFSRPQSGVVGTNATKLLIGARGDDTPHDHFKGAIGELRIWQSARAAAEIQASMHAKLEGNEPDLIGYWRYQAPGGDAATDLTSSQNHAQIIGAPGFTTVYSVFAGINDRYARGRQLLETGNWTHLAATFNQSYALGFDGGDAFLDCGADTTLDISGDLSLELAIKIDSGGATRGMLAKGHLGSAQGQVPYALALDASRRLLFQFEDDGGNIHAFASEGAIEAGAPHRIAVTRKRQSVSFSLGAGEVYSVTWDDLTFCIDGTVSGRRRYADVEAVIDDARTLSAYDDPDKMPADVKARFRSTAGSQRTFKPGSVGRNSGALEIGRGHLGPNQPIPFQGVIGDVRIWNKALEPDALGSPSTGKVDGLVSWWRFEEGQGTAAKDQVGSNHGTINGAIEWVRDPSTDSSSLVIYRDGVALDCDDISDSAAPLKARANQFTLGALSSGSTYGEHFQGEMEELRIWQSIRTQEQIQDNLFRRLTGEQEQLIAYYSFDAVEQGELTDQSFRGNNLTLDGTSYVLSSAPIGVDTPQVRSALAGVKTPFHGTIQGQPGVGEYGDLQYDSDGNLIGAFKRCYSIIKRSGTLASKGEWQLITGFKVGDLVTEWIGQIQFAPQLIGYIEGAPPVPSENLAGTGYVLGEFADYVGASAVAFTQADSVMYTYAASKERGLDLSVDFKLGGVIGAKADVGFIYETEALDIQNVIGVHGNFEQSWGWLSETTAGVGRSSTQALSMSLKGSVENVDAIAYPAVGRRFAPDNVGMAFVLSETADLFALRLKHNNALVSFQMRPNPDIPPDRNIITFPLNPRYTRQGSLDGKIGFEPDPNYPNALAYSSDSSYFKPIEAYALKNAIEREETELSTQYQQYDAGGIGRAAPSTATGLELSPGPGGSPKRNMVNSYVWTAEGGLFAQSQEALESHSDMLGGSYAFKGMGGIYTDLTFGIFSIGFRFELDALFGGHLNRTVTKTKDSQTGFALNVDLGGVEGDVYLRNARGELVMDLSDPRNPTPKRQPGRVDAYRFMSFYLEPNSDHFETFFNKVVDPIWLESDDANAAALREARQEGKKPPCWRILHRVTYVSRVLPPLAEAAPASLEKSLQTLDIDSNYQLIRQLEPFVRDKLSSDAEFVRAVDDAVKTYLPELQPHLPEIKQYLRLYFGIAHGDQADSSEDDVFGQATLAERALNQPPIVDAGPDQIVGMDGAQVTVALDGNVIDDRLERADAIFVTWEGADGRAQFADPHALATTVQFKARGRYALRLVADDGALADSDEIIVTVNQPPAVSAGADQEVKPASGAKLLQALPADDPARAFLEQQLSIDALRGATRLEGKVVDDGLGDPAVGRVASKWTKVSGVGDVAFADDTAATTLASFSHSGHYLLRLTADNGSFSTNDEVTIAVAARVTDHLQALYTFEEGEGAIVHDVTGMAEPFDLEVVDPAAVAWSQGGLTLLRPTVIRSSGPAERLIGLLKATGALTIEAWMTPASATHAGLGRIVTLSAGARQRNVTLGQSGDGFHVSLRTTRTNPNASDRALTASGTASERLTHLVCTREGSGLTRLYLDGRLVAERVVDGDPSNWAVDMPLALGNEPTGEIATDRAWLGTLHLVAVYGRALARDEIEQNYLFGANADLPPVISAGPDMVVDASTLPAQVKLSGKVTHDRPTPGMQCLWTRVAGPGDEVVFDDERALATRATLPQRGSYVLRLSVSDDSGTSSGTLQVVVNASPQLDAGGTADVNLPDGLELHGQVLDAGLGDPGQGRLTTSWHQESGPGEVTLADPAALITTAGFAMHGAYALALRASNGRLDATERLTVHVHAQPQIDASGPPVVTLGADGAARVPLTATIIESGLGDPEGSVTVRWTALKAPSPVTFAPSDDVLQPTAVMTAGGKYMLAVTVDNGHLSASRVVALVGNQAPTVDAGAPQTVVLPAPALLDATIGDDGLPLEPGSVRLQWQQLDGPDGVTFADASADLTEARFPRDGLYALQITADDGAAATSAVTTVEVVRPPRVAAGLLALYSFESGDGAVVHDASGVAEPLDLEAAEPEAIRWAEEGLVVHRPTVIRSAGPAARVIAAIKASQAFTIEAWVTPDPANPTEGAPARIVTISLDTGHRNTTLGQEKRGFSARVRTSDQRPDDRNGIAQQLVVKREPPSGRTHLTYVCDMAAGAARLYADNVEVAHRSLNGDPTSWDDNYHLALANELSGERAWLGTYHLVALYDRALSIEEIAQNFYAGLPHNT